MQIYTLEELGDIGSVISVGDQIVGVTAAVVVVWNRDQTEPVQVLPDRRTGIRHVYLTASPDAKTLMTFNDGRLKVWQSTPNGWQPDGEEERPAFCAGRFSKDANAMTLVEFERAAFGVRNLSVVARTRSRTGQVKETVAATLLGNPSERGWDGVFHRLPWKAADLSADGQWFLLSPGEKAVHVWQAAEGRRVGTVKLKGITNEAAFSPDGSRFAVDAGTTVYVHQTRTLDLVSSWKVKYSYIPQLAWSPDGQVLARVDGTTTVRLFDVDSGQERRAIGLRRNRANAIAFAPDGLTYLVGTVNGSVVVWDVD